MLTLNKFNAFWASALLMIFSAIFLLIPRSADVLFAGYNQNYPYYNYNNYYPNNSSYYNYNAQPSGNIYQQASVSYLSSCLFTSSIAWSTQNVSSAQVTVINPSSGQQQLFAAQTSGSGLTPWLEPGNNYVFSLWNTSNGQQSLLAQTSINMQGYNCGQNNGGNLNTNPTPVYPSYPNYPVYGTNPTSGSGNNLSGSFSLTSNNNYCVGQTPTYTISAPSNWSGQIINWTSSHNGISSQTSFTLSSAGQWTASGNTWGGSDVGSWQKTADINGVSQTLYFSVQNCGGTTVVNNPYPTYPNNNDDFGNTIGGSTVNSGGGLIGGSVGSYGNSLIGGSVYGSGPQTIGGSTTFN